MSKCQSCGGVFTPRNGCAGRCLECSFLVTKNEEHRLLVENRELKARLARDPQMESRVAGWRERLGDLRYLCNPVKHSVHDQDKAKEVTAWLDKEMHGGSTVKGKAQGGRSPRGSLL